MNSRLRVLIVSHYASAQLGGEGLLPLQYFRLLRLRKSDVYLLTHEDTKNELEKLFPEDSEYIHYVPDTSVHRLLSFLGSHFHGLAETTVWFLNQLHTQFLLRKKTQKLVKDLNITVVHQPVSVSPKMPSAIFDVGAPVVIGPMNGDINYPPGMQQIRQSSLSKLLLNLGRWASNFLNFIIPGKRRAKILLVANSRTRDALPFGSSNKVFTIVENGVDLSIWKSNNLLIENSGQSTKFIFIGRLVRWKGLDLLLESFYTVSSRVEATLEIIGDGIILQQLERRVADLGLSEKVSFLGWLTHEECADKLRQADVFVLPSLLECGGAVVLEAMAMSLPVIASNWGGPPDYIDSSCGILVEPTSKVNFIEELTYSMVRLAQNPNLRIEMGQAGKDRVYQYFDWERKVDQVVQIYQLANS